MIIYWCFVFSRNCLSLMNHKLSPHLHLIHCYRIILTRSASTSRTVQRCYISIWTWNCKKKVCSKIHTAPMWWHWITISLRWAIWFLIKRTWLIPILGTSFWESDRVSNIKIFVNVIVIFVMVIVIGKIFICRYDVAILNQRIIDDTWKIWQSFCCRSRGSGRCGSWCSGRSRSSCWSRCCGCCSRSFCKIPLLRIATESLFELKIVFLKSTQLK